MKSLALPEAVLALGFLAALLVLVRQSAYADVESPRVILGPGAEGLVVGPGMNAAGRDLRGSEFVTQDLSGAIFDGCNLYGVRIKDCILRGASFRGAVFTGAHVEVPADEGADFTDATINACGVSLAGEFFSSTLGLLPHQLTSTWSYQNKDLRRCPVFGSPQSALDLRGADLRQAMVGGDLSKCDFTNARIDGAFFCMDSISFEQLATTADFKRGSLRVRLYMSAHLTTRSLGRWDLSSINLTGSDLSYPPADAVFTDATINDCTIRNGLAKPQLCSTRSYQQGNLSGLCLMSSDLSGCDLSTMNLTGCSFSRCKFRGASLEDAVITNTTFILDKRIAQEDKLTVGQIKSTWNYKHGRMEGIRLPEELAEALRREEDAGPSE